MEYLDVNVDYDLSIIDSIRHGMSRLANKVFKYGIMSRKTKTAHFTKEGICIIDDMYYDDLDNRDIIIIRDLDTGKTYSNNDFYLHIYEG